jgi:hypothetical protein
VKGIHCGSSVNVVANGGANARVLLGGKSMEGRGSIIEDEHAVAQRLSENFK